MKHIRSFACTLNIVTLIVIAALIQFGCAQFAQVKTWAASPQGTAILNTVAIAADVFGPQYAGVIGLGINSLEAPTGTPQAVPSSSQIQTALASVTGNSTTSKNIATLASAVLAAATTAPTPNAGLAQAAVAVNAKAAPALAVVQFRVTMPDAPPEMQNAIWRDGGEYRSPIFQI